MSNVKDFKYHRALKKTVKEVEEKFAKSGDGGDNGDMEHLIGKLEGAIAGLDKRISLVEGDLRKAVEKIDRNFLFMLAGFASVLGVLAKGFGWL